MILMILSQKDIDIQVGLFESIENGREFAKKLPGYKYEEEVDGEYHFVYETMEIKNLEDYQEIPYKNILVPITRHSFPEDTTVDIYWQELPNLDDEKDGLISGTTRVDAYIIDNQDVGEYIETREKGYKKVAGILETMGYESWRDLKGSEDGEAIIIRKKGDDCEMILSYLDPEFVERVQGTDSEIEKWLMEEISTRG